MNSSTVAFVALPRFDEGAGDDFGAQFDAAVRDVAASDVEIAAAEAKRARRLARVAEIAERMSRADGSAATAAGREWARRRLVTEVACATKRSERTTARMIDDSERLVEQLPLTLASLEAGSISYAHAKALIAHAITIPEGHRQAFEQEVLPHAEALPAHRFDDRARRLRERLHPESIVTRTRAALEERHVVLTPDCDGMATILHHLPAVDALVIDGLIDRVARAARSETDDRTHAQRRCDALSDLVLGRGDRPGITPSVLVTIAASTLDGIDDAAASLHGYGPIDPVSAREVAALAPTFLHAVITSTGGSAALVTRRRTRATTEHENRYSASPALRTVLALLDETCRFPGCGRRADRCELDHTHAWSEGGRTTADNLAHLCSRHHHLKHEGGWHVSPSRDGARTLTWTSPRGAVYVTRPESQNLTVSVPDPPPS